MTNQSWGYTDCHAAWRCLGEVAAVRRDAAAFARCVLTPATYRSIGGDVCTWSQVELNYMTSFFEDVDWVSGPQRHQDYVVYRCIGKRHRTHGPAVEWANGDTEWYFNDKTHRSGGPAIEYATGTKLWYVDGMRHRVDGPAVERADGVKEWYVYEKLHRTDGPAVEHIGFQEWWLNNKLHRTDGPAIERVDGYKVWCVDGYLLRVDGTLQGLVDRREAAS